MNLKRTIWLAILAVAGVSFSGLAKADSCSSLGLGGPTCLFNTDVVFLEYGTLTLLSPDGSVLSSTNILTAETGLADFTDSTGQSIAPPAALIAEFPSLIPQLQSDPQTGFADLPSYLYTGLASLADANGFGFASDPNVNPLAPPDQAVDSFDAQRAAVGGPYVTVSDTGYQTQPFSQAACDYDNSLVPGLVLCSGPSDPGFSQYEFTYQLGPDMVGANTYTSLVNFQIFSRDVTEQLVATPEPGMLLLVPVGIVFAGLILLKRRLRERG